MSKQQKIISAKFDSKIEIKHKYLYSTNVRIGSINPNKLNIEYYEAISTNGKEILYKDQCYTIIEFLSYSNINNLKNLMVLTIKERNLILPPQSSKN